MSAGLPVNVDAVLGYVEILSLLAQADVVFAYLEYLGDAIITPVLPLENWDGMTAPTLTGWTVTKVVGTALNATLTNNSANAASGTNYINFNFGNSSGCTTRLNRNAAINMTTQPSTTLEFWLTHDGSWSGYDDKIQLQTSIDGGANWVNQGAVIHRVDGSNGWKKHLVDLSALSAQTSVLIAFLAISGYGADVRLDDMSFQPNIKTSADVVFGYLEYRGGSAQVDTLLGYVEIGNGNTPAIIFGPRWQ